MSGLATGLEIAVIGMSCHFPGAPTVEAFLENLRNGVESIRFFTEEELRAAGVPPEALANPAYVRAAGMIEEVESFDADYFGYNPREAELIDPQQRLFLERAVEALERAGCDPARFGGTVGVYAGMSQSNHGAHLAASPRLRGVVDGFQILVGNDRDFLASRVAYKLDLQGPALVVQTACSTSLAAVHLACQALLAGDCDMALAGGVSARVPQVSGYLYQEEGIASPDGHCRTFDARANGTVGGSGVGVVVLRRLADALLAGDPIQAVIRGSAINNDGANKLGYTAPRIDGQAQAIRAALAMAEVEPGSIGYLEAHGTATALGDPVEVAALNQVFGAGTGHACAIGTVKSNFGHLDAAAGVAGLIKAALSVKHGQVFPSLHFEAPNPKIDFAGGPFQVATRLADWPTNGSPRRAGVSSFGMGGTNVHVVIEEPPPMAPSVAVASPQLLVLSARTETALAKAQAHLAAHLASHPELDLADVAFTLARGRRELKHRAFLVAADGAEAAAALLDPARVRKAVAAEAGPAVALMFTGQGSQQVAMAEGLYVAEPSFRQDVDACCDKLAGPLAQDLRKLLYPSAEARATAQEALRDTALAQPALFVLEYALARLWMRWGLVPQAMIGHSLGEYVAACLAGVFSLEDALGLVAERGRLMAACAPGAMLAVGQSADRIEPLLDAETSLAARNAPEMCVIAGPLEAIEGWRRRLEAEGIGAVRLVTSHAFHSPAMDPAVEPFRRRMSQVTLSPPSVPFVSNVTGTWITAAQATDPGYWARHLRAPVQFARGVAELLREPSRLLLEVGPGEVLASLVRRQLPPQGGTPVIASLPPRSLTDQAVHGVLEAAGRLWLAGVTLEGRFASPRRRVVLPTYPFERRRFEVERPRRGQGPTRMGALLRQEDVADWFYVPSWRRMFPLRARGDQDMGLVCLFVDRRGLGLALAERLRGQGGDVVLVEAGTAFVQRGPSLYSIDPAAAGDYRRLLEELAREGRTPRRVLHLWGIDDGGSQAEDGTGPEVDRGFFSLLHLAQALGTLERVEAWLGVVTAGVHEVTGRERLRPGKAAVLGALRVIPMEYPSVVCRGIDLDGADLEAGVSDGLLDRLEAEMASEAPDPLVALRGSHRWRPAYEPIRLPASDATRLRRRGVYLVTGGRGGIGLALAGHLASQYQARLVLVSRREPEAATRERLEAAGAEVLLFQADVTDAAAMARVVEEAEGRFGAIHGVIHAAGVAGGGVIQLKTRAQALGVVAAKITGTLVLDRLFQDRRLDFMVLCSSLTAVLGAVGQADYVAANAFLDAYAQHAACSRPLRLTTSIAWDTWRESGMAVETELPRELAARRAELIGSGLTNAEGVEVFVRALAAGLPHLLVSTRPFHGRIEERSAPARVETAEAAPSRHPRPSLQNDYVPPKTELEKALAETWAQLLGIDRVGLTDNFFEAGGESLAALRLVALLKERRGLALSLTALYEAPTIERLIRRLEGAADTSEVEKSGRRGEARAEAMAQRRQARRR